MEAIGGPQTPPEIVFLVGCRLAFLLRKRGFASFWKEGEFSGFLVKARFGVFSKTCFVVFGTVSFGLLGMLTVTTGMKDCHSRERGNPLCGLAFR